MQIGPQFPRGKLDRALSIATMIRQFRENTVNPTARKKSRQKRTRLRLRKEVDPFLGDDGKCDDDSEPVNMGLNLIDVLFSMFDIRGHIPDSHRVEAET